MSEHVGATATPMGRLDQTQHHGDGAAQHRGDGAPTPHTGRLRGDTVAAGRRASRRALEHEARSALLRRAVEGEIVPRLLLAHPAPVEAGHPRAAAEISPAAAALAKLAIGTEVAPLEAAVAAAVADGMALDRICIELLQPAAGVLGSWWDDDRCSFADVTLGTWRLQQELHRMGTVCGPHPPRHSPQRQALITPMPGEQHGFGAAMVAELLRQAGWDVEGAPLDTVDDLVRRVRREWFAVVGISLGRAEGVDALTRAVAAIRRASCNPAVGILVGGPVFIAAPELARRVGADATAADGPAAVRRAEMLLARAAVPSHAVRID